MTTPANDNHCVTIISDDRAQRWANAAQNPLPDLRSTDELPRSARLAALTLARPLPEEPWVIDLSITPEQIIALVWVPPDLEYFTGHFPGNPLLPGVVQVLWATQLAQSFDLRSPQANFCGTRKLKYTAPVLPGDTLTLVLQPQLGKIAFRFSSPDRPRSQGTLLYRD